MAEGLAVLEELPDIFLNMSLRASPQTGVAIRSFTYDVGLRIPTTVTSVTVSE